jgi:diadenosine tetraphosphatase ApaH/serine/threonine PP2A family protein phosphatase
MITTPPTGLAWSALIPKSRRRLVALLLATAVLAGCGAMSAQNPGTALSPVNAVALAGDPRVMLAGHDVVAYFTEGRHRLGSPAHRSVHEGVSFHFASAEHQALFDADPARYLPQFGGYCANGIVYGIPWGGDADTWLLIGGRLYIFGGALSKAGFELDLPGNLALAERYWRDEVAGRNSIWQRSKRLVWRVPHYQSGAELAAAVEAARQPPR